jgi:DNA-binding CsgD family transcriptional regulator
MAGSVWGFMGLGMGKGSQWRGTVSTMIPLSDLIAPGLAFAAGLPALTLAVLLWRGTGDRSWEILGTGLALQAILAFLLSAGVFASAARLVVNHDLHFVLWNTTFLLSYGSHLVLRRFVAMVIPEPGPIRSFPRLFSLVSATVYGAFLVAAFATTPPAITFEGRLVYALSAAWYLGGYLGPALRLWRRRKQLPGWLARLVGRGPLALGPAALVLLAYGCLRLGPFAGRSWPSLAALLIVLFFVLVTIELFGHLARGPALAAATRSSKAAEGQGETADRVRRVAARCIADPLTKREVEILSLLLEGWRNVDIATRLGLSPNTVKNHVYNVYQKTGAANRIELARFGE